MNSGFQSDGALIRALREKMNDGILDRLDESDPKYRQHTTVFPQPNDSLFRFVIGQRQLCDFGLLHK